MSLGVDKNGKWMDLFWVLGTSSQGATDGKCWETRKHTIKLYSRESFLSHSACQSSTAVIHSHNLTLLKCHSSPTFQELCTTINLSWRCKLKGKQRECLAWCRKKKMQLPVTLPCLCAGPPPLFKSIRKPVSVSGLFET